MNNAARVAINTVVISTNQTDHYLHIRCGKNPFFKITVNFFCEISMLLHLICFKI